MNNYETRLEQARAERLQANAERLKSSVAIDNDLRKESVETMTAIINKLGEELNLDAEKLKRSIKTSRRSAYGRVPELITKVASIYAWPLADASQISEIDSLQEQVIDVLHSLDIDVDEELLMDIKEAKGYTTWLDQTTFEVVEGMEPDYDNLEYHLTAFATAAGLPVIDYKMTEAVWQRAEAKSVERINTEKRLAEEALQRHNEMLGA